MPDVAPSVAPAPTEAIRSAATTPLGETRTAAQPVPAKTSEAADARTPDLVLGARIRGGQAQIAADQPEQARLTFEALLATQPNNLQVLNGLGIALDALGRHDEAQAAYRRGLALAPEHVATRNNLGLSLALSGRYAEAIDTLRPIALGDGAVPRARQNLAIALALKGDSEQAANISRIDLPESDVENNLNILASVRH